MEQLFLIGLLFIQGAVVHAQNTALSFDIILHNKTIGHLDANRVNKDGIMLYQSSTTVKTRLIKDIFVNYTYNVAFENNYLQKADVSITMNQKPHTQTRTQTRTRKKETQYLIVKNDKDSIAVKHPITYSTIQLYFEEPVNHRNCYSEQDGNFTTIIPMGNHSYKKINSKKKENMYYYKGGVLQKATIDGGLIRFEMIAREP